MFNSKLFGALSATALTIAVACAGTASAATVTFSSNASWINSTCSDGCSNQGNTYVIGGYGDYPQSRLITTDFNSSFSTDATAVRLGEITWENRATDARDTDSSFNLTYSLTLDFSAPSNPAADTTNFVLAISQPENPPGDIVNNLNVAVPLVGPFNLAGVTVSNIRWILVSGSGGSTFNNGTGTWYNPENNNATLRLVADFKATPVPEPASFAILGAGLLGLAAVRRRRQQG